MMSPVTRLFQVFITSHPDYVKGLQLASIPPASSHLQSALHEALCVTFPEDNSVRILPVSTINQHVKPPYTQNPRNSDAKSELQCHASWVQIQTPPLASSVTGKWLKISVPQFFHL